MQFFKGGLLFVIGLLVLGSVACVTSTSHVDSVDQHMGHLVADDQGPTLTLSIDPAEPRVADTPTVTITAIDTDGIDTVILSYWTSSNGNWVNETATKQDSTTFTATIPPTDAGTNVTYKAYANDSLGNWGVSDVDSYITGEADQEGPEIVIWYAPLEPEPGDDITVYALIGDPSGVNEIELAVSYDNTTWTNQSMTYDDSTLTYSKNIGPLQDGQIVYFKIYASDSLGNWATSELIIISLAHNTGTTSSTTTTTTTTQTGSGTDLPIFSLSMLITIGVGVAVLAVILILAFKFKT